jgi:hypothetical protein
MTYFFILAAVAAVVWLAAVICGSIALRFGWRGMPQRFLATVVLAAVALAVGLLGLKAHITYSQTVNGRGWRIDSSWFFWLPLALGAAALALALWRRFKTQPPRPTSPLEPRTS